MTTATAPIADEVRAWFALRGTPAPRRRPYGPKLRALLLLDATARWEPSHLDLLDAVVARYDEGGGDLGASDADLDALEAAGETVEGLVGRLRGHAREYRRIARALESGGDLTAKR